MLGQLYWAETMDETVQHCMRKWLVPGRQSVAWKGGQTLTAPGGKRGFQGRSQRSQLLRTDLHIMKYRAEVCRGAADGTQIPDGTPREPSAHVYQGAG